MGCTVKGIPEYLHFSDGKKIYSTEKFRFYHLLFRTGFKDKGNPFENPDIIPAYSVCWSKLIKPDHVLQTVRLNAVIPDNKGDNTYFGKVKDIRRIKIEADYSNSPEYSGKHLIVTEIVHTPFPCNYSHCEILIKHTYFKNGQLTTEIITTDDWKNKKCLLRNKSHKDFFQPIINEYKAKIATAMNSDISELDARWYIRMLPKNVLVSLSLWKAVTFHQK